MTFLVPDLGVQETCKSIHDHPSFTVPSQIYSACKQYTFPIVQEISHQLSFCIVFSCCEQTVGEWSDKAIAKCS